VVRPGLRRLSGRRLAVGEVAPPKVAWSKGRGAQVMGTYVGVCVLTKGRPVVRSRGTSEEVSIKICRQGYGTC
jgi:hypothetical protein